MKSCSHRALTACLGALLVNPCIGASPPHRICVLKGDVRDLWCMAFSPDGNTLVSGGGNETVLIWDIGKCKKLGELRDGGSTISLAVSPDGKSLVSSSSDKSESLWNLATFSRTQIIRKHERPVCCQVFSPDGTLVAAARMDRKVLLWDVATGKTIKELTDPGLAKGFGWPCSLAFRRNGKSIAIANECMAREWDVESGNTTFSMGLPYGEYGALSGLALSARSDTLVAGERHGMAMDIWDLKARTMKKIKTPESAFSICFSDDGSMLAVAIGTIWRRGAGWSDPGTSSVLVFDAKTFKKIAALESSDGPVICLAWSPKCNRLACGTLENTIEIWDLAGVAESSK